MDDTQDTRPEGSEPILVESPAGIDTSAIRAFIAESARIKEAEKELKALKADLELSKKEILDGFAQQGIGKISIDGKTVYTHQQLWAGKAQAVIDGTPAEDEKGKAIKVENEEYIAAIKAAGLQDMVKETISASTLSAWVRGIEDEDEEGLPILPPELVGFVQVTEKFDVRIRKA